MGTGKLSNDVKFKEIVILYLIFLAESQHCTRLALV